MSKSIEEINSLMAKKRQRLKDNPTILQKALKDNAIVLGKKQLVPEVIAHKIYEESWSEERGSKLYKHLAEKYDVGTHSVKNIVNGKYNTLIIHPDEHARRINAWNKLVNRPVTARSPGNDLLEYYDESNYDRGEIFRLLIPVSTIFHYRFIETEYKWKDIYELFPSIKGNTLRNTIKHGCPWLVNEPHKKYEFENPTEFRKWAVEQGFNGGAIWDIVKGIKGYNNRNMVWKGAMRGWSFFRGTV